MTMSRRGTNEAPEELRVSTHRRDEHDRVRVAGSRGGSYLVIIPRRELQDAPHQLRVLVGIFGNHSRKPHARMRSGPFPSSTVEILLYNVSDKFWIG